MPGNVGAETEDVPVAVGDGFRVTEKDVREVVAYFEKGTYRLPEKTYRKNAVMLNLFALEAMNLKLDEADGEEMVLDDSFESRFKLGSLYTQKLMDEYIIPDNVIESYYLAHPDLYGKFNNEKQIYEMPPMSEDVRKQIREKVLTSKKMAIQDKGYEDLIKKYRVRFCDAEGGCE
jgi:hypothetical protein